MVSIPSEIEVRGTVVVLAGQGERIDDFGPLTERLVLDGYRVELFDDVTVDVGAVRAGVRRLLGDPGLPSPRVLLGSDVGATLAASVAAEFPAGLDAVVLAGLVTVRSRRSAPHAMGRPFGDPPSESSGTPALPSGLRLPPARALTLPSLVFHGDGDEVTDVADAVGWASDLPRGAVRIVQHGGHDVVTGVHARTVTASLVLFLERQRSDGPVVVDAFATRPPRDG